MVGKWATIFEKEDIMRSLSKTLASAALGAGLLAVTSVGASAAIACSGDVCWHTHEAYRYPPDARIIVHRDNWRWGPSEHFTFREHEGRGYWRGDNWERW
jgi:hypothetical protein